VHENGILMTSDFRHHYVVLCKTSIDGTFYILVTFNVEMNCAKIYENLLNFAKLISKILDWFYFFRTQCMCAKRTMSKTSLMDSSETRQSR